MSYILAGSTIRNPQALDVDNSTQIAENRTLSGAITRDLFGTNKRIWTLTYENTKIADYNTIDTIYQTYLLSGTPQTWQVTETNYTVASTNVHVDLKTRSFRVRGIDYISNFTLILTEA